MIKVFKLVTGEDLIGEVFNVLAEITVLKDPAQIILQRTEKGMGVGLAPFMPYANEHVKIYKSAIVAEVEPNIEMENEYRRIFGSGIQIAPAGSI